jgi:hypothetical protein
LTSVKIQTITAFCEEREALTLAYLDATQANRKASYSIDEVQGSEWSKATEQTRRACDLALAALKLHIDDHKCLRLESP